MFVSRLLSAVVVACCLMGTPGVFSGAEPLAGVPWPATDAIGRRCRVRDWRTFRSLWAFLLLCTTTRGKAARDGHMTSIASAGDPAAGDRSHHSRARLAFTILGEPLMDYSA